MKPIHKTALPGIYTLWTPESPIPLVFDSPHSGTTYPPDFDYACDFATLEKAEDKFVDDLFINAPNIGASLLCANFPRTYIDVNRCKKDIDVDLLADVWPEEIAPTPRSHAGVGLIRRLVRPGVPLYNRALKSAEIRHRIDAYYRPYHETLESVIENAHYRFGAVWHINCHSMPSRESSAFRAMLLPPVDFVLGDRDGTSCELAFTHAVRDFLRGRGYRVAINDPYKGVELVRRYSNPATGRHSLQIEISRALYLDEQTYKKSRHYEALKADMDSLIHFCADYVQNVSLPMAAD